MSESANRKDTLTAIGCTYFFAALAFSVGVGGFVGWPWGLLLFGGFLLYVAAGANRAVNRKAKDKESTP